MNDRGRWLQVFGGLLAATMIFTATYLRVTSGDDRDRPRVIPDQTPPTLLPQEPTGRTLPEFTPTGGSSGRRSPQNTVALIDEPLEFDAAETTSRFTLAKTIGTRSQDTVLSADPAGLWVLERTVRTSNLRRVSAATGEVVTRIDLREWNFPSRTVIADGERMWFDAIRRDSEPGTGRFVLMVDTSTGATTEIDVGGLPDELVLVDGVVWAVVKQAGMATVVPVYPSGETGTPTVVFDEPDPSALIPVHTVTSSAVYDCAFGTWGVTPHGGERREVSVDSEGCTAVAVGNRLLHVDSENLWLIDPDRTVSPMELPVPIHLCKGPQQPDGPVAFLVCLLGYPGPALVVAVDLEAEEATIVAEVGTEPPAGLTIESMPTSLPAPIGATGPQPLAVLVQRTSRGEHRYVVTASVETAVLSAATTRLEADKDSVLAWYGADLWLAESGDWQTMGRS